MPKHLRQTMSWKSQYNDFETYEEALIRLFNDPQLREEYPSPTSGMLDDIASQLGATKMAVNKHLGRLRKEGRIGYLGNQNVPKLSVIDKKLPPEDFAPKLLKLIVDGNKLLNARDVRQEEVYPKVNWKKWIGLCVGGDWHIDHYRTYAEGIVADLKKIGQEPYLYYGFNGDLIDMLNLRFIELENETLTVPSRRLYEVVEYLVSLVPNMLFMVTGCHDNWVRTRARYDIIEAIQQKIFGYYLGFGGTLNFQVGDVTYRIVAKHKHGHESSLNHFHPCYNYLRNVDATADVIAVAHRHDIVGISHVYWQGVPKIFIRSGSHQYKTNYAWKEGFTGAVARYPMLLLNGTEKRMIAVCNFREGLPLLRRLNEDDKLSKEVLREGHTPIAGMKP